MAGLDDMLSEWLHEVEQVSKLSTTDKVKITNAGAKVFKRNLEEVTRKKHYSDHEDKARGHMADSIEIQNTNLDKTMDGTAVVGFDKYHAINARRLNDGTKKYSADHFVDETRQASADEVFAAEKAEYDRLLSEKGAK